MMTIKTGDIIRLKQEDDFFCVAEVWSDKEILAYGGRIIEISDIEYIVDDEEIADMLLDRCESDYYPD